MKRPFAIRIAAVTLSLSLFGWYLFTTATDRNFFTGTARAGDAPDGKPMMTSSKSSGHSSIVITPTSTPTEKPMMLSGSKSFSGPTLLVPGTLTLTPVTAPASAPATTSQPAPITGSISPSGWSPATAPATAPIIMFSGSKSGPIHIVQPAPPSQQAQPQK